MANGRIRTLLRTIIIEQMFQKSSGTSAVSETPRKGSTEATAAN
jgi:hypothetical protein